MSRIGNKEIHIHSEVSVTLSDKALKVSGPKGILEKQIPPGIEVDISDGVVSVRRNSEDKKTKALHGLTRALINNMVVGVSEGYTKHLEMVGVGYRAEQKGNSINLSVMKSHQDIIEAPEGITIKVEDNTKISVSGIDKQQVGHVAALIRSSRPPNAYTGKGVRYAGEEVTIKPGKSARAET